MARRPREDGELTAVAAAIVVVMLADRLLQHRRDRSGRDRGEYARPPLAVLHSKPLAGSRSRPPPADARGRNQKARPSGGRSRLMGTLGLIGVVLRRTRAAYEGGSRWRWYLRAIIAPALEVLKPWPLKVVIDNVLRGAPLGPAWPGARRSAFARAPADRRLRRAESCSTWLLGLYQRLQQLHFDFDRPADGQRFTRGNVRPSAAPGISFHRGRPKSAI